MLRVVVRVLSRGRRNRTDLYRWLIRRPAIMGAVQGYEMGLLMSNRVDARLKVLAELKTSSRVGCPF